MTGDACRAPAPGKSQSNRSMMVSFNPSMKDNIFVYVFSDDLNEYTAEIMRMKDEWRALGFLKSSEVELTEEQKQKVIERSIQRKKENREKAIKSAARFWKNPERNKHPLGTIVQEYIEGTRGLYLPSTTNLRHAVNIPFWDMEGDNSEPSFFSDAMMCRIEDCNTGEGIGIHLTYLDDNGEKNALCGDSPRKIRGATENGCIRLWDGVSEVRAVAEGVESALAYSMCNKIPCDSSINHHRMREYLPPEGCKKLYIAYDNDITKKRNVGLNSANILAEKIKKMGIAVELHPSPFGCDWNDYTLSKCS